MELEQLAKQSVDSSYWDYGNKVLYDLCQNAFEHKEPAKVIAKVWIIGRSYAAAIERRKDKTEFENDDFYIDVVAPKIVESDIDDWLYELKQFTRLDENSLNQVLEVHEKVTQLFKDISGLDKRSLASKYLHFHLPHLFYIYDARAVRAISYFSHITGRAKASKTGDKEYNKLVQKCTVLQRHALDQWQLDLSPRQIDNVLLMAHANA
ncbi:hypothetical protein L1D12_24215 [Vibrio parahaemolyticus]|uniref:hypothetical protein n=1 Tax=Vibrio parahaemolyticus TaxID=670 RepID=UPI001EFE0C1E|nr:hypothetical protein [Vibrio parahaemolyticus]MCG9638316.1 hypothetical protein [Vibrio parahaemolyticus]